MAQNTGMSAARPRRPLAALLLALALSPGLFWRTSPELIDGPQPLEIVTLALPVEGTRLAPGVTLAGGWQLDSRSNYFGGYSALVPLPRGELLALSDRGYFVRFALPAQRISAAAMGAAGSADDSDKRLFDIESATRDPASGTIWLGYEGRNAIARFDPALREGTGTRPAAMAGWPANRGPEALARLADGRFVVLSEALGGDPPTAAGLLFPGDPLAGGAPAGFRFATPPGFSPTDMAQLPDGRVVILLRRIDFFPWLRLTSRLVVADPAAIVPGKAWPWRPLAEIRPPLPAENYEGLAVEPRAGGAVRLWLISDDNGAAIQRTLLLALDWVPRSSSAAIAR